MPEQFSLQTVRITTKERPTDRFLTTQIRETPLADEQGRDDLYFLLEIHNPWFPNSQIGQTIINTIIREYRRSESTSVLVNFELALRKTNAVLAQVTQNGETDWIGNLSSLILLVTEQHIHLAQTGRAHAYLVRGEKISTVTEGLEAEASLHPLTTYTNITTGSLEEGDRLILASSEVIAGLKPDELRQALLADNLQDAARGLVRTCRRNRITIANLILLEVSQGVTDQVETLYLDQSLNTFPELTRRLYHQAIRPSFVKTRAALKIGRAQSLNWTRDWLIPHLVIWTKNGGQYVKQGHQKLLGHTIPLLTQLATKTTAKLQNRHPKLIRRQPEKVSQAESANQESLLGQTIYRVHHYDEPIPKQPSKFRQFWANHESRPSGPKLTVSPAAKLRQLGGWVSQRRFLPSRRQAWFLSLGLVLALAVSLSVSLRRANQMTQITETAATAALAKAKTAQAAAERAFLLNNTETAQTEFLEAVNLAQTASASDQTATEARAIIKQSQAIIDKLMKITRYEPSTPVANFSTPITMLTRLTDFVLATSAEKAELYRASQSGGIVTSVNLPAQVEGSGATVFEKDWLVAGTNQQLYRFESSTNTVSSVSGPWPKIVSLASFSTNLYVLDSEAGQIWKYPASGQGFSQRTGYLKTADPTTLAQAQALAIDGDVYLLLADGSVRKYNRGSQDETWKLSGLPEPQAKIQRARGLFTAPDAKHLYLFEDQANETEPARLIEFAKTGAYLRQLIFPTNWPSEALWFDSVSQTGLVVNNQQAYQIDFTSGGNAE